MIDKILRKYYSVLQSPLSGDLGGFSWK